MANKMRVCIVCGKEYEYCNTCRKHSSLPAWMAIYHNENCKNIMGIATEYMAGNLTKAEAKNKLGMCDLKGKKNFKESIIKAINEICVAKKVAKPEKETNIEEEILEQTIEVNED